MSDQSLPPIPNLALAQLKFILASGPPEFHAEAKVKILEGIRADSMAPFYSLLLEEFKWEPDNALMTAARTANEAELQRLESKINDAQTNLGETDISDALIAKAEYLARIGEKEKAIDAYGVAFDKTGPLGARIDMAFAMIRIGFFFSDNALISKKIEKCRALVEEGGDWDRRNRLKVYEGIYLISIREFKGAVEFLLDTLATFTSSELMDYKDFVKYAVLTAALVLKRPDFKKRIVNAPEILEVINEIQPLADFVQSLYKCEYTKFFISLAAIEQQLKLDRILNAHYKFYVRELRIIAYAQLLESYRSLAIESMANSFGVLEEFIDADLSKLIAAGRLNAVIDKVGGIVETNRPDAKNAQYQSTIKQGDLLLNRVQKLSRVISV